MPNQFVSVDPIGRFYEKVIIEPNSGCHLWTADCFENGYGKFWFDRKSVKAHQFAYLMFRGEIPKGMFVCHKCDTPSCVNPNHLFIGTAKDNTQDCIKKGRRSSIAPRGEFQNKAILKEWQIPLIRADKRTARIAAHEYGISERQFCAIRQGRYWGHLT